MSHQSPSAGHNTETPSTDSSTQTESNGRTRRGRFDVGNQFAKKKPQKRPWSTDEALRRVAVNSVDPVEVLRAVRHVQARAGEGDLNAAKLLFDLVIGCRPDWTTSGAKKK